MADEHIPKPFYQVTITRVEHVRDRESAHVKLADTGGSDGGAKYGWSDKPEGRIARVERGLLKQEVAELDVTAVICAVNGITPKEPETVYRWNDEPPQRRFGECVRPTTNDVVEFPDGHHEDVSQVTPGGVAVLTSGTQWGQLYVHRENNGITRTLRILTERYSDEHTRPLVVPPGLKETPANR